MWLLTINMVYFDPTGQGLSLPFHLEVSQFLKAICGILIGLTLNILV